MPQNMRLWGNICDLRERSIARKDIQISGKKRDSIGSNAYFGLLERNSEQSIKEFGESH